MQPLSLSLPLILVICLPHLHLLSELSPVILCPALASPHALENSPPHLSLSVCRSLPAILGSTEASGAPVSAMKLVNAGGGGGGVGGTVGGGGGAGVGGGAEKTAFSFKKCSAFQFVKRKVSLEDSCLGDGGVTDGARALSVLVCSLPKMMSFLELSGARTQLAESQNSLCDITVCCNLGSPKHAPLLLLQP